MVINQIVNLFNQISINSVFESQSVSQLQVQSYDYKNKVNMIKLRKSSFSLTLNLLWCQKLYYYSNILVSLFLTLNMFNT